MKFLRLAFTLIGFSSASIGIAQTLEHTYSSPYWQDHMYVEFTSQAPKYIITSDTGRKVTLYNLDHSIYTTFSIPKVAEAGYDRINADLVYVNDKLINADSEIEFIWSVYYTNSLDNTFKYYVRIYNESGTLLFEKADAYISRGNDQYDQGLIKTPEGYKLILYKAVYGSNSTDIYQYGVTGSIPTSSLKSTLDENYARLENPQPNPSAEATKISFELPQGEDLGEIFVYNSQGLLLKKYMVDNTFGDLLLNNQDLPSGTYYYNLMVGNKHTETKKMIIIK